MVSYECAKAYISSLVRVSSGRHTGTRFTRPTEVMPITYKCGLVCRSILSMYICTLYTVHMYMYISTSMYMCTSMYMYTSMYVYI